METKRQRFVRLANARVNRAIKEIRLVGNLSNRAHYEYSPDDVRKLIKALDEAIRTAKSRFDQSPDGGDSRFLVE
jgi:tRNA(Met) C34 N-acetyltransferase TmcA